MLHILICALSFISVYGRPTKCDQTEGCMNHVIDTNKIKCEAYRSCENADMTATELIACNGYESCFRGKFKNVPDKILCNGFKACIKSGGGPTEKGAIEAKKVACNGFKACYDVGGGLKGDEVVCDGDMACDGDMFIVSSGKIQCNGNRVCRNTQIQAGGDVYCDGDCGCQGTRIQASHVGAVRCHGKLVCKGATVQEAASLTAYGFKSNAFGTIFEVPVIEAYGYYSLLGATIYSRGHNVNISAYGYKALWKAVIQCQQGNTCTIDCYAEGCKKGEIYVDKLTTLDITPAECHPCHSNYNANKKNYAGIVCPKVTLSANCPRIPAIAANEATDIVNVMAEREWTMKSDPIYIETMEELEQDEREFELRMNELYGDFEAGYKYEAEKNDILARVVSIGAESNGLLSGVVIGWISLAVIVVVGIIYVCYAYRRGEYKALSS